MFLFYFFDTTKVFWFISRISKKTSTLSCITLLVVVI